MATDLNRLHQVVTGQAAHRRCGITYAHCHEVAAAVCLGHQNVFLVAEVLRDVQAALCDLSGVLREYELELRYQSRDVLGIYDWNGTKISTLRLCSRQNFYYVSRGINNAAVVFFHRYYYDINSQVVLWADFPRNFNVFSEIYRNRTWEDWSYSQEHREPERLPSHMNWLGAGSELG